MALRLVKQLRKTTMLSIGTRGRPAQSDEIIEPPHDFYIVKDYDRNPFYQAITMIHRPGFKYNLDPFLKHTDRRDPAWTPKYKGHQIDISLGWSQLVFFILLPIQAVVLFLAEIRYHSYRNNPLGRGMILASEF